MERDLLLHYLREMYELILDAESTDVKSEPPSIDHRNLKPAQAPEETPEDKGVKDEVTSFSPEKSWNQTDTHPKPLVSEEQPVSAVNGTNGKASETTINVSPDSVTLEVKDRKGENKELTAMFEESRSMVLSSRLGQLPISDIGKSMGINDRILTINELFKGDKDSFLKCTKKLNEMDSFDQAQEFLLQGVAAKNDWSSPIRRGKALTFLQLIRRRYL